MFPDTSKSLVESLGILEPKEKVAYRATFIVDPAGIVQWVSVRGLNVGRDVAGIIRTLGVSGGDAMYEVEEMRDDRPINGLLEGRR